jgi:hypothetical protein
VRFQSDPVRIGERVLAARTTHPELTASERADMIRPETVPDFVDDRATALANEHSHVEGNGKAPVRADSVSQVVNGDHA